MTWIDTSHRPEAADGLKQAMSEGDAEKLNQPIWDHGVLDDGSATAGAAHLPHCGGRFGIVMYSR
jgi:hypothetical protein